MATTTAHPTTAHANAGLAAALDALDVTVLDVRGALARTAGRAVVVLDDWTLESAAELSRHALAHPVTLVPVRCDGAVTVVGPVLRPGAVGCLSCTEYRRLATIGGRVPWHGTGLRLAGGPSPAMADAVAMSAAGMLDADPRRPGPRAPDPRRPDAEPDAGWGALVRIVHSGRTTWSDHVFRPVGGCPVCLPLPPDDANAARPPRAPRPLSDPTVLRGPNDRTGREDLRAALYDERFGPVHRVTRTEDSVHSLTSAYVTYGRDLSDGGYGRAGDWETSERVALFEAVERLTGMSPQGRRTVLRASYAELGPERAVDPERLGLPDPSHHGHPASGSVAYDPELALDWVHGWSLTRDRVTAVPEHVAYWDPSPGRPRVVYECSSGCGLGNSPQEAALYGLFEVAERDAFLMAWYGATPLRRIALPGDDLEVVHLADRAESAGYRLDLFDATNDFGIPAVIAVAAYGDPRAAAPQVFVAAGAHHDPRVAVRGAVVETVTNVFNAPQRMRAEPEEFSPARLLPMLERPELVRTLADHTALYTLPEARPRLGFLLDSVDGGDRPLPWRDAWPDAPEPVADLAELLDTTVRRLAGAGLEVIVVGQDEAGVRERLGLYGAKAVVPGALPMTFGHVNRRTRGLPRLLEVPYRLGRAPAPLRHEDLALHPHPFP
ncbi:TOMM precursor leader peptide-binding protein [Streptomyces sp. NPDC051555]|uniref:TOMM precursor leader peptide-binding protein n=1 Tax=Streptomyces sp. NPDC051555 TaxID=3365657 RepID=UPI00378D3B58